MAETRIIASILSGEYAEDEALPGERDLAARLGVTRPTLREALQRLARDGWIQIHHGRPTRVRNFWLEGNLGVLEELVHHAAYAPADFVPNLMEVRGLIAPTYARQAVERAPAALAAFLAPYERLPDSAEAFAQADWALHREMAHRAHNPVFTLLLNSFGELYPQVARAYFSASVAREWSRAFYRELRVAAAAGDATAAAAAMARVSERSLALWREMTRVDKGGA